MSMARVSREFLVKLFREFCDGSCFFELNFAASDLSCLPKICSGNSYHAASRGSSLRAQALPGIRASEPKANFGESRAHARPKCITVQYWNSLAVAPLLLC